MTITRETENAKYLIQDLGFESRPKIDETDLPFRAGFLAGSTVAKILVRLKYGFCYVASLLMDHGWDVEADRDSNSNRSQESLEFYRGRLQAIEFVKKHFDSLPVPERREEMIRLKASIDRWLDSVVEWAIVDGNTDSIPMIRMLDPLEVEQ